MPYASTWSVAFNAWALAGHHLNAVSDYVSMTISGHKFHVHHFLGGKGSPPNLLHFTLNICPLVLIISVKGKGFLQSTLSVPLIILYTSIYIEAIYTSI